MIHNKKVFASKSATFEITYEKRVATSTGEHLNTVNTYNLNETEVNFTGLQMSLTIQLTHLYKNS